MLVIDKEIEQCGLTLCCSSHHHHLHCITRLTLKSPKQKKNRVTITNTHLQSSIDHSNNHHCNTTMGTYGIINTTIVVVIMSCYVCFLKNLLRSVLISRIVRLLWHSDVYQHPNYPFLSSLTEEGKNTIHSTT